MVSKQKHKPDTAEEPRFVLPKASISYDREGRPIFGVRDAIGRVPLVHGFEAAKVAANQALEDRLVRPPPGYRTAGRHAVEEEWTRRRQLEEADEEQRRQTHYERSTCRILHLRTSPDNFLYDNLEASPADGTDDTALSTQRHRVQSLRTYGAQDLPRSLHVHVANCCAALGDDAEDTRLAAERAEQSRRQLEQIEAARTLGCELSQAYPHGLPRLALLQAKKEHRDGALLADLSALRLCSASVRP